MAIRGSDMQMLGSLDLRDLENCLFKLEYLPMLREARTQPKKAVNPKNSSNATQLQQEEAFIEAFWRIVNPKLLPRVQNAHVYDILLLVIYKVNQPLGQTVQALSEYLCNYYEGFCKIGLYNFGSDQENTAVRKVDQYLAMQKLWSVNRLILTFKQMNTQRYSNLARNKSTSKSPVRNVRLEPTQAGFGKEAPKEEQAM